ncbi:MAG: alpha-glucan family phosphorylase, partial [Gemmatimonadales bacterium]
MNEPSARIPHLPQRIAGLALLATNLWWAWSRDARRLFRTIDELLWHRTRHNPIEFLQLVDPARLVGVAEDAAFLARYDRVMGDLDGALAGRDTWFRTSHPDASGPVAYFCAEFGLHNSVPIYSGGLGVLAGDHCKGASDLGVPLVGVGLLYTKGYFDQRVRIDGWQEDADDPLDPTVTPLVPLLDESGLPNLVTLPLAGRTLHVGAWRMMVGSVPVYLLDTNLEVNDPQDRSLSLKLYAGGPEMRLRQEWVLGIGGVRLLRKLGIAPTAWHANEGHAAFMLVERLRELMAAGTPEADAVRDVRARSVFTTHTPVPAGHDVFTRDQVAHCAQGYLENGGLPSDLFYRIGHHPQMDHGSYHMTLAAIRLSGRVNGVSELHGHVSRDLWRVVWPTVEPEGVPIGHVTNGVHLATWMAYPIMELLDRQLGPEWGIQLDQADVRDRVLDLDPASLWQAHLWLKHRLLEFIREEARRRWREHWKEASHLVAAGTLLSDDALTIGFARRFATYKRADLLFRDPDRLRQLLVDPRRPVQIIFAGKAHPADEPGKRMLQRVYGFARDPAFEGRVTFLEDH